MLDSETLKSIKENYSLNELYEKITGNTLKRSSKGYIGICPFHEESNASFHIYRDNKYYCYGCFFLL